ncbi:MAG: rRNA methyltransferase, partial [Sphingobium sp.]|nr:rRNA methyltransferase [Sphingobium sp.]
MAFYSYILRCADGSYYTGHTDDLEARFAAHQSGAIKGYTSRRLPVELMWSAAFATRAEAMESELQIKGWSREKKEALIAEDWAKLKQAAISHTSPPLSDALRLRSGRTEGEAAANIETMPTPTPVIVLVRPQLGENIGKAARAMLNFGLTEMRLVSPRDGWPNPDAGPAAAGADVVLDGAQVYETLADAVADCAHVYATTVRKRGVTKPVV